MSENYTCDELKRMSELYLATNETCSDRWYNILRKYSFATEGVALFTVACVGVLANMLSIATLGQRTMKSKISALLITLAVFDIVFLLCTFPVFTVQSVNAFVAYLNECHYNGDQNSTSIEFMSQGVTNVYYYCLPYFYGMTHVSKVGSVFTTLAVSLERYFAVCRPLWIRIRRCHPSFYIILVNVFAFAFNIPKFLEFESVDIENGQTSVQPTTLRTNPMYVVYYNFWIKTLVTELFPYGVLIFLSGCIYREIRRSVKRQQAMRCTQPQKEEIKSANVVVGIVLMSILCHIWKIVPDLYEAIQKMSSHSGDNNNVTFIPIPNCSVQSPENEVPALDIEMIIDTSHLLVGINSAANFFLYYLLRKNFRAATLRLLTCKGGADADQQRKTMMMSTYTSVRRTHSNNVTMNKTFDSNGISIDNRSSDRMSSFKYNQEPRRFRNSESGNTEPNGFHGRTGSSRLEPPKSNQNHHNTVVASVKNGFNNEQELDILINKEPDEICLAEFSEGNGVVVQKNKKNSKQRGTTSLKKMDDYAESSGTSSILSVAERNRNNFPNQSQERLLK